MADATNAGPKRGPFKTVVLTEETVSHGESDGKPSPLKGLLDMTKLPKSAATPKTDTKPVVKSPPKKEPAVPAAESPATEEDSKRAAPPQPPLKADPQPVAVKSEPAVQTGHVVTVYDDDLNYPVQGAQGLIIVNETFRSGANRTGAHKDCEYLTAIYDKLSINCQGQVHRDVKGYGMLDRVETFSENISQTCTAIFVSLSTHGDEGGKIMGTDGKAVELSEMIAYFQEKEELLSIPKVFIVQACKGTKQELQYAGADSGDGEAPVQFATKSGDTLICYSTSEGFVSWRDPKNGSWFLKILHDCIMHPKYRNLHFVEILTVCSNLIVQECAGNQKGGHASTETPSYYSTLRRFLRFQIKEEKDDKALT